MKQYDPAAWNEIGRELAAVAPDVAREAHKILRAILARARGRKPAGPLAVPARPRRRSA